MIWQGILNHREMDMSAYQKRTAVLIQHVGSSTSCHRGWKFALVVFYSSGSVPRSLVGFMVLKFEAVKLCMCHQQDNVDHP